MKKLTIVVTCTSRKKWLAAPGCSVRELPLDATLEARADVWRQRLEDAEPRATLRDLYRGDAWQRSLELEAVARAKGFDVDLLVASAGLGLRSVDETAPGYGATFAPGHPDSVGQVAGWWREIAPESAARIAESAAGGALMFVMSASYARALGDEIRVAASQATSCLIVGGAYEVEGATRVAPSAALASYLGGTLASLNQRTALEWIRRIPSTNLVNADIHRAWESWAQTVAPRVVPKRAGVSDEAVRQFVGQIRARDAGISRTRALRELRDAGYACEQSRFNRLFSDEVKA